MRKFAVIPLVATAILLTGCFDSGAKTSVELNPGEVKIYQMASDEPLKVGFKHLGSPDIALACQGRRDKPYALPLPECAGVYESDGREIIDGTSVTGLHGAAITFTPINGKVIVALKNLSKIPLNLELDVDYL